MRALGRLLTRARFARAHRRLRHERKVIYGLTPPPRLSNIGDHAQAVAIEAWIARQLPGLPVIELDKDLVRPALPALQRLVGPDDLVLLHSGGNLGDRGLWSENGRRALIAALPDNRVVSLPQTIHFSETDRGRAERAKSVAIYGAHPRLAVLGRDPRSAEFAAQLFPRAVSFGCPDMVLSLPPRPGEPPNPERPRVLACLRLDNESRLSEPERARLADGLGGSVERFDTTLDAPIAVAERRTKLDATLDRFRRVDAVVTDRYHGLIFAVLTRRPTVVLPTVDHKLTSAAHWFESLDYVRFAEQPDDVPQLLKEVLRGTDFTTPDWNRLHFDRLLDRVEEEGRARWEA